MSKAKELEILESKDCKIKQADVADIAKTIARTVAEQLEVAPSNAAELVEAIEVTVEPIVVHKVMTRLILR